MAPTDRSMPAVRMTIVWPTARAATTAACCSSSEIVVWVRKRELTRLKTMPVITRISAGLIEGCSWTKCCTRWVTV